ncbi:MAG: BamA/TamA family outer membrane protein [candidate division Zixibacteria bacterium]|nr:BamA/TamA family outer membrane protein [candidate division Zixibacteria bacterium]
MSKKLWWGCLLALGWFSFSAAETKIIRLEYFPASSALENWGGKRVISRPKIGLALSGGGARGFSQIGILKVLEKENIPIHCIAGTSIGGIVGGLFAAGYSAGRLEQIATSLDWMDLLSDTPARLSMLQPQREETEGALFQIRWQGFKPYIPAGLTSAQKLTNLFANLTFQADYFSGSDFDRLKIPFRAVTTDLITGRKYVFSSGELALALRATMAVPLAITPVSYRGMLLVDGGLVDPIPVDIVRQMGADLIIAVNTSATLLPEDKIKDPLDIASQSTSIMSLHKKTESLEACDLVIEPQMSEFLATDFAWADSLIYLGSQTTQALLPQLKQLIADYPSGEKYEIKSIDFSGNSQIPADSLKKWIDLSLPARLSSAEIYRLLTDIYSTGYFRDLYAEISGSRMTIHLQENPPATEVIVLNKSRPDQAVASLFLGNPHPKIINYHQLKEILDDKLDQLRRNNLSLAQFSSAEYDSQTARLTVYLDEGRVEKIDISGNENTKDWLVRSHFPLKEGDPFNLKLAQKGLANLQSSGYFDQVNLGIVSTGAGANLNLNLKEKQIYLLRGGAHWWDEYHLEGFLEFANINLFGTGNKALAGALYGDRREKYYLDLKADRIFRTYLTYQFALYYKTAEEFLYSGSHRVGSLLEVRRGLDFSLGQNMAKLGKISLMLEAQRILSENTVTQQVHSQDKRGLTFQILFDNLDRYPYPNSGNYNQAELEFVSHFLGGDASYRRFYASLETYLPITPALNFRPSFRAGMSDRELPIYDKFSLGGPKSVYGYKSNQKRGDKFWQAGAEIRLRSARRVYWFATYDLWQIGDRKVNLTQVFHGAGLKLGITTPLGPIELAYGANSDGDNNVFLTAGFSF